MTASSVSARFARRMEAERNAAGLSALALARAAGVHEGTIRRAEALGGGMGLETAVKVVRVLREHNPGFGLDWLIDGGDGAP